MKLCSIIIKNTLQKLRCKYLAHSNRISAFPSTCMPYLYLFYIYYPAFRPFTPSPPHHLLTHHPHTAPITIIHPSTQFPLTHRSTHPWTTSTELPPNSTHLYRTLHTIPLNSTLHTPNKNPQHYPSQLHALSTQLKPFTRSFSTHCSTHPFKSLHIFPRNSLLHAPQHKPLHNFSTLFPLITPLHPPLNNPPWNYLLTRHSTHPSKTHKTIPSHHTAAPTPRQLYTILPSH